MKHKIELYVDEVFDEHEVIKDPIEIAKTIKGYISHLGKFDIYITPKPETRWQKIMRAFQ